MICCTVDVTGRAEKVVNVWMKFANIEKGDGYECDGPRTHTFSFHSDNRAMKFARKCVNAGLKAKVFPIAEV